MAESPAPHPGSAERLHEYWVHGEGAAKIRWGEPGDFDRCTRQLMDEAHFTPEQAHGYCNLAEHAATGRYPAQHAAMEKGQKRMTEGARQVSYEPTVSYRTAPLEDISIRSTGDGRTVEAYAAVFDTPSEVHDQDGDYMEVLDRTAFNRAITDAQPNGERSRWGVRVLYNHGLNVHGGPSDHYSVPIGVPLEIRPDGKGLYTVTRFHKTPLAEEILEAIREGSIEGYSFSGTFRRSDPNGPWPVRRNRRGEFPRVRRMEASLREYGPTMFPVYKQAAITGVRSTEEIIAAIAALPYEERLQLASRLTATPSSVRAEQVLTADAPDNSGLVTEDSRRQEAEMRSGRSPKQMILANRSRFITRHGGTES